MKIIIAGSRQMPYNVDDVPNAVRASEFRIEEVVCGMARGADTWGKQWAEECSIPVHSFPADWNKYGRAAGAIRNKQMAEYADGLIIFIYQNSRGSRHMFDIMNKLGKPSYAIWR